VLELLTQFITPVALLLIACSYAAIGHGGASGYLAVLLIAGFAPTELRPVVLMLNILVTIYILSTQLFLNKKHQNTSPQSWFIILILTAIPAAFLGGSLQVDESIYRLVLGALLLFSVYQLLRSPLQKIQTHKQPKLISIVAVGSSLGFLSGLTGIGGGVLLSPLLLFLRWADIRNSIPLVAAFILFNSCAGLAGWYTSEQEIFTLDATVFASIICAVFLGAIAGRFWSTRLATDNGLRYLLSFVLAVAGTKMLSTAILSL